MLSSLTLHTPKNVANKATVIATVVDSRAPGACLPSSSLVADSIGSISIVCTSGINLYDVNKIRHHPFCLQAFGVLVYKVRNGGKRCFSSVWLLRVCLWEWALPRFHSERSQKKIRQSPSTRTFCLSSRRTARRVIDLAKLRRCRS